MGGGRTATLSAFHWHQTPRIPQRTQHVQLINVKGVSSSASAHTAKGALPFCHATAMPQRSVVAAVAALFFGFLAPAQAHRDGCHRWHSCPIDSGSYVCGDLGYTSGCPMAQPLGGTVTPAAAPPLSGPTRRTTTSLNLRFGPSTTSTKLATLNNGTTVGLLGCGNGWCQVKWQGRTGYVSQQYLK